MAQFSSNSVLPSMTDIGNTVSGGIADVGTTVAGAAGGLIKSLPIVNVLFGHKPKDWRVYLTFPQLALMWGASASSTPTSLFDDPIGWATETGEAMGSAFLKSFMNGGGNTHLLDPLRKVGNKLIFPYTPAISVTNSASYNEWQLTHTNYTYFGYQNSRVEDISIDADFPVEIEADGLYWIACVHFMRIITKMAYGHTQSVGGFNVQGNPPPVVYLNGYGDFMFPNVPVIVKQFKVDLPKDVDYIQCTLPEGVSKKEVPMGSSGKVTDGNFDDALKTAEGAARGTSVMDDIGSVFGDIGDAIGSGVEALSEFMGLNKGFAYVPTKSSFNIVVSPIYSRTKHKFFSLDDFIDGKYVFNKNGLI